MADLFGQNQSPEQVVRDVYVCRQLTSYSAMQTSVQSIHQKAPFRFMSTPGGKRLRISMTNSGEFGWISDAQGYRYAPQDPTTGQNWPAMPADFIQLAEQAARTCGFDEFTPNACLINHYLSGRNLSAHQDKNEPDLSQPIVSVSLGMSARFQIFGDSRQNKPLEIELYDGDVMVWGRSARLMYHGVKTNHSQPHPQLGLHRINLTFRQV